MAADLSPIDKAKFVAAKRAVDFVENGHEAGPWHRVDRRLDGALPGRAGARGGAEGHRRCRPRSRTAELARQLGITVDQRWTM